MNPNWPTKKLGEVAEFINGYPFSPDDWEGSGLPIIRIQNLNDPSKPYNYFQGELDNKYLVDDGDILISWSASLGVYLWSKGPAWLNQHIFKVRENPEIVNHMYFYFVAQTVLEEMKRKVHGGTMQHITKGPFGQIKISVPSLPIQQKIVGRLDAVRKAQNLNEKQISLANELFQSLLRQELNPEGKEWETRRLKDICDMYQPKTITSAEILEKGPYKVFGANGVIGYYDRYNHEDPEVLVTCRGATCGTINLSEPKCWITGNAMVVKPKSDDLSQMFLYFALEGADLFSTITGAAQPQITRTSLSPFRIPLPPLKTQHQIVEKLSAVQDYKKKLLQQKELLQELFDSTLDRAMKGELIK